jgi:hypothetical protein
MRKHVIRERGTPTDYLLAGGGLLIGVCEELVLSGREAVADVNHRVHTRRARAEMECGRLSLADNAELSNRQTDFTEPGETRSASIAA